LWLAEEVWEETAAEEPKDDRDEKEDDWKGKESGHHLGLPLPFFLIDYFICFFLIIILPKTGTKMESQAVEVVGDGVGESVLEDEGDGVGKLVVVVRESGQVDPGLRTRAVLQGKKAPGRTQAVPGPWRSLAKEQRRETHPTQSRSNSWQGSVPFELAPANTHTHTNTT